MTWYITFIMTWYILFGDLEKQTFLSIFLVTIFSYVKDLLYIAEVILKFSKQCVNLWVQRNLIISCK